MRKENRQSRQSIESSAKEYNDNQISTGFEHRSKGHSVFQIPCKCMCQRENARASLSLATRRTTRPWRPHPRHPRAGASSPNGSACVCILTHKMTYDLCRLFLLILKLEDDFAKMRKARAKMHVARLWNTAFEAGATPFADKCWWWVSGQFIWLCPCSPRQERPSFCSNLSQLGAGKVRLRRKAAPRFWRCGLAWFLSKPK